MERAQSIVLNGWARATTDVSSAKRHLRHAKTTGKLIARELQGQQPLLLHAEKEAEWEIALAVDAPLSPLLFSWRQTIACKTGLAVQQIGWENGGFAGDAGMMYNRRQSSGMHPIGESCERARECHKR